MHKPRPRSRVLPHRNAGGVHAAAVRSTPPCRAAIALQRPGNAESLPESPGPALRLPWRSGGWDDDGDGGDGIASRAGERVCADRTQRAFTLGGAIATCCDGFPNAEKRRQLWTRRGSTNSYHG